MIFKELPCFSSSSFENTKLTNHSTNNPEIMHVHRFSSDLVHRHIVNPLTSMIISPNNTLYEHHTYVTRSEPCEQ